MAIYSLITTVLAIAIMLSIVSGDKIVISKTKQDKLLHLYLTSDESDEDALEKSDWETKAILGFQNEETTTATLLKIRGIGALSKQAVFSQFDRHHMEEVDQIFDLLYSAPNYDAFIQRATVLKPRVNRHLLLNAVQKTLLYRRDTNDVQAPPLWQVSARSFFTDEAITAAITKARADTARANTNAPSDDIPMSRVTTTMPDPESELAWFREDISLNSMHYVISAMVRSYDDEVEEHVTKRFSLVGYGYLRARYNLERRIANLKPTQPIDTDTVIEEGYDSHLATPLGNGMFAPRPSGKRVQDIIRGSCSDDYTVSELKYIKMKADEAIQTGVMIKNDGTRTETTPVNLFRTMFGFYGGAKFDRVYGHGSHMYEHQMFAGINNQQENAGRDSLGILGTVETSMRDPLFYRIHQEKNVVEMYHEHLEPYSKTELAFPGLEITDVQIVPGVSGGDAKVNDDVDISKSRANNVLTTFMETMTVDVRYDPTIAANVDGAAQVPVMIGVKRLNHDRFKYKINAVSYHGDEEVSASIRTFMAPSINRNTNKPFENLIEQRESFFLLDKFDVNLHPGNNVIERQDIEFSTSSPSSLLSIDDLKTPGIKKDDFAGCMWPQNLLLPRGSAKGEEFDVFVLITEWKETAGSVAKKAAYTGPNPCGVMDYTDSKLPGYPFERKMSLGVADYLVNEAKNTFVAKVKIVHQD